jgi:hypothetical protein
MIAHDEHAMSDSHSRFVLANPPSEPMVLSRKVMVFGVGNDPHD